jgi:hypothetical protein
MTMVRTIVLCASALAASMPTSYAGPCSQAIDRMRAQIDAKLGALAAGGPSAKRDPGSHDASSADAALDRSRRERSW